MIVNTKELEKIAEVLREKLKEGVQMSFMTLECYNEFSSFEGRVKVKTSIRPEELLIKIENFLESEGLLEDSDEV